MTTRLDFIDQHGERVAEMRFRILRFRPADEPGPRAEAGPDTHERERPAPGADGADGPEAGGSRHGRTPRPRPVLTQDNAFFFEGAREGRLLIQRCASCGTLRHPPRPACPKCRSFDWDTVESSGRGVLYSYVVVHHPRVPGFDYPLPIALVELEEGTRLVADLTGVDPAQARIGMPVECEFVGFGDDVPLPVFHPAERGR